MSDDKITQAEFDAMNHPFRYELSLRDKLNEAYADAIEGSPEFKFLSEEGEED